MFDADARKFISGAGVCLQEGRILSVLAPGEAPHPGFRLKDCRGYDILPGFVDSHVHLAHSPEMRRERYLLQGVTRICDMGTPLSGIPVLRRQRDAMGRSTAGAHCTGPVLTAPGGYPVALHGDDYAMPVADALQAVRAVELLYAYGARILKLAFEPGNGSLPVLGLVPARAAVRRAHELDMRARAHISGAKGLARALESGVDGVEHLPLSGRKADIRDLFKRMADTGVILTPTLDVLSRSQWDNRPLLELVALYHHLGGRMAVGTDAPFFDVEQGAPCREMALLRSAGLDMEEVLLAATLHGGEIGGWQRTGVLAPGCTGDVQVVHRVPDDFETWLPPVMVFKDGDVVFV